ncbi:MAG TPA: TRAP transporter large permease [Candidatus Hydrogenedentes bacterium]|nr:TRAP transporter large permease [Candidatus Hydrogenedentota bacterium]
MTILLLSLVVLLFFGIPIAYSIGISSLLYFAIYHPEMMQILPQRMFFGFNSYTLIALPLFILMGFLMNESGITARLLNFCMMFVGRLRGGLGLVNVGASMIFGGISGSSTSDTASIGSILIPEMEKRGYPRQFAAGITVASSTMGMIIPPSIPVVLYAIVAQESVGQLFLGGMIPGIMIGLFQFMITMFLARRHNFPKEDYRPPVAEIAKETILSSYVLLMPILIVSIVVLGVATPTESSAIAVLYAAVIGFAFTRKLKWPAFWKCVRNTVLVSSKIMIIIALSQIYIFVLALEHLPEALSAFLAELDLGSVSFMLIFAAIVLLLGTFIDVSPAILLLTPIFLPSAVDLGISPVHFGIVLVSGLAVGACTPPVGNCLNVCSAISRLGIGKIFIGALPFLTANVGTMLLCIFFPDLVMWLPKKFMGE